MKTWDNIWRDYKGLNFLGRRLERAWVKTLAKILHQIEAAKDAKIIDVGCGRGSTLQMFRKLGYFNSVGIDISENALMRCTRLFTFKEGKDVFLMDARSVDFPDASFNLVFSDGMLEHFETPPLDIVSEFCRISNKYVLLLQPNQTSLFGRTKWLWQELGRASWQKEYRYSEQDYVTMLQKFGAKLLDSGNINFKEHMWLLFENEPQPALKG